MFTLGCTLTTSFSVYYGMRAMMGFMLTARQTIGLAFIQDTFFFHEHAKKIGFWTAMFLVSPYCGPLFAYFIISGTESWRAVYCMMFGLGCGCVLLIVLFIDEPWYRRDIGMENRPTSGPRFFRLLGTSQAQQRGGYFLSVGTACRQLTYILFKPIIIPIMIY
jgi:MFS family permease